jgi:hypothetical protein
MQLMHRMTKHGPVVSAVEVRACIWPAASWLHMPPTVLLLSNEQQMQPSC